MRNERKRKKPHVIIPIELHPTTLLVETTAQKRKKEKFIEIKEARFRYTGSIIRVLLSSKANGGSHFWCAQTMSMAHSRSRPMETGEFAPDLVCPGNIETERLLIVVIFPPRRFFCGSLLSRVMYLVQILLLKSSPSIGGTLTTPNRCIELARRILC